MYDPSRLALRPAGDPTADSELARRLAASRGAFGGGSPRAFRLVVVGAPAGTSVRVTELVAGTGVVDARSVVLPTRAIDHALHAQIPATAAVVDLVAPDGAVSNVPWGELRSVEGAGDEYVYEASTFLGRNGPVLVAGVAVVAAVASLYFLRDDIYGAARRHRAGRRARSRG